MRAPVTLCLAITLLLAAGCRSASVVPDGWSSQTPSPASTWQAEAQAERDRAPRMQVFIHYNRTHSSHTALRITVPDGPAVFWDPGGAYGKAKPSYGRKNDVILNAPPDLPTWWVYRRKWLKEPFLYIFEWDIAAPQARAMQKALLEGAANGRQAQEFQTLRTPGLCVLGMCEFLRTYGPPHISPELRTNVLPNTLAHQLWQQNPDRVLRYEGGYDATPTVLTYSDGSGHTLAEDRQDPNQN